MSDDLDQDLPETEGLEDSESTEVEPIDITDEDVPADEDFPIGSPVSSFGDDLEEDEDPHSSFDKKPAIDDTHADLYGVGAPEGFEDDFEEDEDEEDALSEADIY